MALAACAVGPDYVRPEAAAPATFKEAQGWKVAQPRDQAVRGKWWEAYGDATLNQLQDQVNLSNQDLALAQARFQQARALLQSARAAQFPIVTGTLAATRAAGSGGRSAPTGTAVFNNHSLVVDADWEIDLWGRLRRNVEANAANAQASEADLAATRLSVQAQLAQAYFQLRTLDAQQQLLDRTVADYLRSLQLTQNQYENGVVARGNVVQAQTQYKTTQAQAIDLGVQRAQIEHAIALLVGKAPSEFSLPPAPLAAAVPDVPFSVPSTLLERRPDIAAAERRVAAANAQIGVATAAYYPDLLLSASGGFSSGSFTKWFTLPNRIWSIGPEFAMTLFDAGARRAQTDQATAAYDANVATYRQTVLSGFQEVEDNLAAMRILEQEAQVQDEAVQASRLSVELITNQYKAGIVSYLNVIQVQTTALSNERTALDIQNRRLAASVLLIKALGGGWEEKLLAADAK
jgi:NodT family efflux transporter outer membrane factor (OMF) lipoprotein